MKIWISFFGIALMSCKLFFAQGISESIQGNNHQLKTYMDSLEYCDKQLRENKIDFINYQVSISRISSEISMLAGSNFEITYPVVDSVTYAYYIQKNDVEEPNLAEEERIEMDQSMDSLNMTLPSKIKMPLAARALGVIVPSSNKRTKLGISFGVGFTGVSNEVKEFNYPEINLFNNFYFQNIMLNVKTRLGGEKSKLGVKYGIGLNYVSLKQKENFKVLELANGKPTFYPIDNIDLENIESIKFRLKYLKLPINLTYNFNKKLSVRTGVYYNLLLRSREIIEFDYKDNKTSTVIHEEDFGFNKNVFGLEYAFNYGHFEIHFEHSLNSILNKKADADLNYFKVGINIK